MPSLFQSHPAISCLLALICLTATIFGHRLAVWLGFASNDYIPSTDPEFDLWQLNFNTLIQASPATYGLDDSAAAALDPLSSDFHTKLSAAVNVITRTKVTVAAKDASKAALKSMIRSLAALVQATVSVSNDAKVALGLPINDNAPSPIPAPATFPVLGIAPVGPARLVRRFADQTTPASSRKPAGAAFLLIASKVSADVIVDPDLLTDSDIVTRQPNYKDFNPTDSGKKVYTAAKWVTAKGLEGPWSAITMNTIP